VIRVGNLLARRVQHVAPRLEQMHRWIVGGEFVLPAFQRPYVWTDADVALLLDSIANGFYVGTLVTWHTPLPPRVVSWGGVDVMSQPWPHAVLDGQQRIGAIARAMSSDRFCVHLQTGEILVDPEPAAWVWPVRSVVRCDGAELFDAFPAHATAHGLPRRDVEHAFFEARRAFETECLSVVQIGDGYSAAEVVEMFRRINVAGVRVTPEELAAALATISDGGAAERG
jgi:hypothetical protein